jgi:hypothetical protein
MQINFQGTALQCNYDIFYFFTTTQCSKGETIPTVYLCTYQWPNARCTTRRIFEPTIFCSRGRHDDLIFISMYVCLTIFSLIWSLWSRSGLRCVGRYFLISLRYILVTYIGTIHGSYNQGCHMVSFQTKNPNLGKF